MPSRLTTLFLLVTITLTAPSLFAAEKIQLFALFKDKAIIKIDGARRVLARGETSPEGVRLLATDTLLEVAEIELDGRRETLKLGVVSAAGFADPKTSGNVTLYADRGFFYSDGKINGAPVRFLVDTGANAVALSSQAAKRIGLDYKRKGRRGIASTAGGMVPMYSIKLESVTVGDITLYNVEAGVIEGDHPTDVLLGMSFLGRVDMKRDGDKMELTKRY
jgi:aspartyl protease family protein